ncbi:hypothetical protein [Mycobacterium noviomagense]|uniref:hypothetical protein n=1 Tax=Mycobacterium noviomagense TaxID=459858 RepID=UPI00147635E8|nr:hypothetical protein [Mycobacterium noviomagense]
MATLYACWWRPAATGFAALAIATKACWWRPAATGFAALAIAFAAPTGRRQAGAATRQL